MCYCMICLTFSCRALSIVPTHRCRGCVFWPTYVEDRIWHRCADRSHSCIIIVSTPPVYSCGLRFAPNLPLVSIFLLLLLTWHNPTRSTCLTTTSVNFLASLRCCIFTHLPLRILLCYFHSRFLELRLLLWMLPSAISFSIRIHFVMWLSFYFYPLFLFLCEFTVVYFTGAIFLLFHCVSLRAKPMALWPVAPIALVLYLDRFISPLSCCWEQTRPSYYIHLATSFPYTRRSSLLLSGSGALSFFISTYRPFHFTVWALRLSGSLAF